jgi:DNA (cytosine-5)-methyltransferase 1
MFCQIIASAYGNIFRLLYKPSAFMAQITTTEAAFRLGITDRRVRQMIEEGLLKGQKFGRDYLVEEESLETAKERPKPGRPSTKGVENKPKEPSKKGAKAKSNVQSKSGTKKGAKK